MSGYRITKLVCPSCEGTGLFMPTGRPTCHWCKGERRVPVETALRYAGNLYAIAGGGYFNGDHSLEEALEMEADAERIYAVAERAVPWKARAA